jgi:mRNA interferase MazF
MTLHPFDVVVVPFPYSDRLSEKRRPALVISSVDMPEILGRVWLAMITSAPASQIGDVALGDIGTAGLPVASTLRCSKIATLDADRILRQIGRLSETDEKAARHALRLCAAF